MASNKHMSAKTGKKPGQAQADGAGPSQATLANASLAAGTNPCPSRPLDSRIPRPPHCKKPAQTQDSRQVKSYPQQLHSEASGAVSQTLGDRARNKAGDADSAGDVDLGHVINLEEWDKLGVYDQLQLVIHLMESILTRATDEREQDHSNMDNDDGNDDDRPWSTVEGNDIDQAGGDDDEDDVDDEEDIRIEEVLEARMLQLQMTSLLLGNPLRSREELRAAIALNTMNNMNTLFKTRFSSAETMSEEDKGHKYMLLGMLMGMPMSDEDREYMRENLGVSKAQAKFFTDLHRDGQKPSLLEYLEHGKRYESEGGIP